MKSQDALELFGLAALWGASFLFLRIAVPSIGPISLAWVRVAAGLLVLLPSWWWVRRTLLRTSASGEPLPKLPMKYIILLGFWGSALPFTLFAWASLSMTSGFAAILNATVPFWSTFMVWLWFDEKPSVKQVLGLLIGIIGVGILVWHPEMPTVVSKVSSLPLQSTPPASSIPIVAILAALGATACYGYAACFNQRYFQGIPVLRVASASQIAATLMMLPGAILFWPSTPVPAMAWGAALLLGLGSTGLGFVLYFRLIERVGPTRSTTVTFLLPLFAVLWGWLILGESLTQRMIFGGVVVLLGTALASGWLSGSWTRLKNFRS